MIDVDLLPLTWQLALAEIAATILGLPQFSEVLWRQAVLTKAPGRLGALVPLPLGREINLPLLLWRPHAPRVVTARAAHGTGLAPRE